MVAQGSWSSEAYPPLLSSIDQLQSEAVYPVGPRVESSIAHPTKRTGAPALGRYTHIVSQYDGRLHPSTDHRAGLPHRRQKGSHASG